jgi:hypothetical protein
VQRHAISMHAVAAASKRLCKRLLTDGAERTFEGGVMYLHDRGIAIASPVWQSFHTPSRYRRAYPAPWSAGRRSASFGHCRRRGGGIENTV